MSRPVVTMKNVAPITKAAGKNECTWCGASVGLPHKDECVVPKRVVTLEVTFRVPMPVPQSWTPDQIEFHRNESSWCASNWLHDLERFCGDQRCLCAYSNTRYIGEGEAGEEP